MYASGRVIEIAKVRLDERARIADTIRFASNSCALTSYCCDQSLSPLCIDQLALCEACCHHRSPFERPAPYQCPVLTMHPLNRYRDSKPDFAALARKYASFAPLCVLSSSCMPYTDGQPRHIDIVMLQRSCGKS